MPASIAACSTVLPFSTVTERPSIVSVTVSISVQGYNVRRGRGTEVRENTERISHRDTETRREDVFLCVFVSLWRDHSAISAGSVFFYGINVNLLCAVIARMARCSAEGKAGAGGQPVLDDRFVLRDDHFFDAAVKNWLTTGSRL